MAEPHVYAPEFSEQLRWLNTPRPLTMRELRGRVVVLDFWTYCCVNCMHVLPVLRRIEERFKEEPVVVLGVHSAKFDGEKSPDRIEAAIGRYDIHHPILVDEDMDTWSRFAVRSWPTLIVVRPDGTIAAVAPGEADFNVLASFVESELADARKKGTLTGDGPLDLASPRNVKGLSYPGKVAAHGALIAIADSANHRVLIVNGQGELVAALGTGEAGHADGPIEEARFDDPQGLAWKSDTELFVADARSHTIARVDLRERTVTTIAGTGELGQSPLAGATTARETALRSPWDLLVYGESLLVALAGSHQIARLCLTTGRIELLAGTGTESIVDGPFETATFSQPSGFAMQADTLYVADSETSAIRALDMTTRQVLTIIGTGLFDFGDADGTLKTAKLQHCLDIALADDGALIVADTYNNKLKRIELASGAVTTFATGFKEPGGIAPYADGFLVADTNAHRIVRASRDGTRVRELELRGIPDPKRGRIALKVDPTGDSSTSWFNRLVHERDGREASTGDVELLFHAPAPVGKKFASGAPMHVSLEVSRRSDLLLTPTSKWKATAKGGPVEPISFSVKVEAFPEARVPSELVVRLDAVVCPASEDAALAVCEPHTSFFRLPVQLAHGGASALVFEAYA